MVLGVFGLTGATLMGLVGFTFQSVTESFSIASLFLGKVETRTSVLLGLFFVGGVAREYLEEEKRILERRLKEIEARVAETTK